MIQDPDPRTAPEDHEDATATDALNTGVSAQQPAEGADDAEPRTDGSPEG